MSYKIVPMDTPVYKWEDIQAFLCNSLGIEDEQFHDYHKVVGVEDGVKYKDLWYVWLSFVYFDVKNGHATYMFLKDNVETDHQWENLEKKYGKWAYNLRPALRALVEELGINDKPILILYNW